MKKKKRILAALLCGLMVMAGTAIPARADGTKVVTLGADLSEEQKQTMLRYFKVNTNEVQIIYVTNQDERNHLGNYIPLAQIGTRTFSCAYVNPTNSGGIKVRTANLNYVTGNMIASTLTTAGVRNCEVIAACPFKVSGTGALTGIQMAYETASGEVLSSTKKELAVQEIKVTEDLAAQVGNTNATNVVNKAKMEIIEGNVTEKQEIYNIVNNVVVENNVHIEQNQINQVVELMEGIASEDYDYEDVKTTLEHVDENLNETSGDDAEAVENAGGEDEEDEDETEENEDSILNDIDEADLGLGDDVAVSSTEDQSLEEETYDPVVENGSQGSEGDENDENDGWEEWTDEGGDWNEEVYTTDGSDTQENTGDAEGSGDYGEVDIETTDDYTFEGDTSVDEGGNLPEGGEGDVPADEGSGEEVSELSEQSQSIYDNMVLFCRGEYEGDADALGQVMGYDFTRSVTLTDMDAASRLSAAVKDKYYTILRDGTGSFTPDEGSTYMSDELNMMKQFLQKLFSVDGKYPDGEDILSSLTQEEKQGLYNDTIRFLEKQYGEESFNDEYTDYSEDSSDAYYDESSADYSEGGYSEGDYSEDDYSYDYDYSEDGESYNDEAY